VAKGIKSKKLKGHETRPWCTGKAKGKVHSRTGQKGPEGE